MGIGAGSSHRDTFQFGYVCVRVLKSSSRSLAYCMLLPSSSCSDHLDFRGGDLYDGEMGPCADEAKVMMRALLRNEDIHSSTPHGAIIRLEVAAEACTHSKRRRSERRVRRGDIVVRVTIAREE